MVDTVFGVIIVFLSIAHMIVTAVVMLKDPDSFYVSGGEKK